MSLEARIERGGRRVLTSPLWLGLLITAFLVVPVFFTPGVALWIGVVSLTTLLPIVLGCTYLADYIYRRVVEPDSTGSRATGEEELTAIDRLRHAYATGEINEETFERKLDRLLETEDIEGRRHRNRGVDQETEPLTE